VDCPRSSASEFPVLFKRGRNRLTIVWNRVRTLARLPVVLPLLLFGVGLIPRLLALDTFLTSDEYRWLGRSRDFLAGLIAGDWGATLQTGHPGVTTMWTGSLGILYRYWTRPSSGPDDLLTFVQGVPNEPLDVAFMAPMRFPTVLLTSLLVVAVYLLVSRLFDDRRVGTVAALLLALNPFHIALSRILHHDALVTTFMTLSLLPLLGYWLRGWSRRWLLLSAIAAGLSFLSKSPAMFLMPFCALLGLIWAVRRWRGGEWRGWADAGRLVGDGLLWAAVAWLTVCLAWPATWVVPLKVLSSVFGIGYQYVTEGHGKGNFFLGEITSNPGILFYPVTWLLRTTPLALLGFLVWIVVWLRSILNRRAQEVPGNRALASMFLLYAVSFVAFMTTGEKKQDRYLLPAYPALEILAALGLVQLASILSSDSVKPRLRIAWSPAAVLSALIVVVLLFSGVLAAVHYPYYFTYYNPLLGGAPTAVRLVTIGWGEGLERAAAYLNEVPNASRLRVTSWYHNSFGPYFQGQATHFASDAGQTLSSDYAVVYRNQIQRQLPTAAQVRYLVQHHTPVYTETLHGVDYVYVYRLPLARRSDWQASRLPGRVTFFGVAMTGSDHAPLTMRLYWQNEGLAHDDAWWVALQPVGGATLPWQECSLRPEFADERAVSGALLESDCQVTGDVLSPGGYHVQVGVGPDADQVTIVPFPEGEFAVAVQDGGIAVLVSRMTSLAVHAGASLPKETRPADLVYGGAVRLVGYATEVISVNGEPYLQVRLYWQALEPIPLAELSQSLVVRMTIIPPEGAASATAEGSFISGEALPAVWPSGQVLTGTVSLPLPAPTMVSPQSLLSLDVWMGGQQVIPFASDGQEAEPVLSVVEAE
jgi:hypothetical protein